MQARHAGIFVDWLLIKQGIVSGRRTGADSVPAPPKSIHSGPTVGFFDPQPVDSGDRARDSLRNRHPPQVKLLARRGIADKSRYPRANYHLLPLNHTLELLGEADPCALAFGRALALQGGFDTGLILNLFGDHGGRAEWHAFFILDS